MKLAAAHLRRLIATGQDLEKTLVTLSMADLEQAAGPARRGVKLSKTKARLSVVEIYFEPNPWERAAWARARPEEERHG
jgi:hypothetical protein